jgi:hypothetical protein
LAAVLHLCNGNGIAASKDVTKFSKIIYTFLTSSSFMLILLTSSGCSIRKIKSFASSDNATLGSKFTGMLIIFAAISESVFPTQGT